MIKAAWLGIAAMVVLAIGGVVFLAMGPGETKGVTISYATLKVKTVPAGAVLTVNGRKQPRKTPTDLVVETGIPQMVKVELAGYGNLEKTVKIKVGAQSHELVLDLQKVGPPQ